MELSRYELIVIGGWFNQLLLDSVTWIDQRDRELATKLSNLSYNYPAVEPTELW